MICIVLIVVSRGPLAGAQVAPASDETKVISVGDARISQLIEQLGSDDSVTQSEAFRGLREVKVQATPALLALLADPSASPERRGYVARVLSYGQPSVIEAIPIYIDILKDRSQAPKLRNSAARSLMSTMMSTNTDRMLSSEPDTVARPDTATLLPVLVGLLEDSSEEIRIRSNAAFALSEIGPDAVQALPTLLVTIRDSESGIRAASVSALGNIGIAMPEVVPLLIQALQDEDENVRDWATSALGKHESKSALIVKALRDALEDDASATIRQSSVMALTAIGPDTEGVVPALIFALHDEHEWVRGEAASALGKANPATPEVISALVTALDDQYAEVKTSAALALGSFGPQAREAIPALTRAILTDYRRSEAYYSEDTIVQALRDIGADMAAVVPSLEKALNGTDKRTRRQAAFALAEIGSEGLPALAKALTVPGLLEEHELRWELSLIEYPLDTAPKLSPEGLQALIHHYILERDRQAASTPDEPERWADEQGALFYLATLEREQKEKAIGVARDSADANKLTISPAFLSFLALVVLAVVLFAARIHKQLPASGAEE